MQAMQATSPAATNMVMGPWLLARVRARVCVCVCGVSRSKGEEGSSLLLGIFGGDQWVVGRVFSLLGLPFGGNLLEE
jgi:hypothetical protein